MDRGSYFETYQTLTLADDRRVEALCYVIDPNNPDYYRDMTLEQKAGIIAEAVGPAGANRDYLFNTHNDLKEMLVEDSEVEAARRRTFRNRAVGSLQFSSLPSLLALGASNRRSRAR